MPDRFEEYCRNRIREKAEEARKIKAEADGWQEALSAYLTIRADEANRAK